MFIHGCNYYRGYKTKSSRRYWFTPTAELLITKFAEFVGFGIVDGTSGFGLARFGGQ